MAADHVHMMISISPKYSVSQVIGCFQITVGYRPGKGVPLLFGHARMF